MIDIGDPVETEELPKEKGFLGNPVAETSGFPFGKEDQQVWTWVPTTWSEFKQTVKKAGGY